VEKAFGRGHPGGQRQLQGAPASRDEGGECDGTLKHGREGATGTSGEGEGSTQQRLNQGEGNGEKQRPGTAHAKGRRERGRWRGRGGGRRLLGNMRAGEERVEVPRVRGPLWARWHGLARMNSEMFLFLSNFQTNWNL
jgi:hypothetical protein